MFVDGTTVYGLVDKELEWSDSEGGNWCETSEQLLDCSRIFYHIFHRIVSPCTRVRKQISYGGIRSATVAEANISRESKVGGNVLEWYPHLMSEKTIKIAVRAVKPIYRNQYCRVMEGFRVHGHIRVWWYFLHLIFNILVPDSGIL